MDYGHENMHCYFQDNRLSYCRQDCHRIPDALGKMYGVRAQCLDLSFNSLLSLRGLEMFPALEDLILDNNQLGDSITFPLMTKLKTLSLNNNQITDLDFLLAKISDCLPNLTYLSLLSNKVCPDQLTDVDKDDSDYQRYRFYVLKKVPTLKFLDSRRVSIPEVQEAMRRGDFMRVCKLDPNEVANIRSNSQEPKYRELPVTFNALNKHRGSYGKCHYKYTGKHSEGNRFILNSDL